MRLAKLAKLSIPEEKVEEFRKKMEDIIQMVENLLSVTKAGTAEVNIVKFPGWDFLKKQNERM